MLLGLWTWNTKTPAIELPDKAVHITVLEIVCVQKSALDIVLYTKFGLTDVNLWRVP